mmetsp:Transcript_65812/g.80535  ORF Transcript_65812/g.80535 Transcript_65812/m.80535 type:complete len:352 (-) Transcript_65812:34-1089(-)
MFLLRFSCFIWVVFGKIPLIIDTDIGTDFDDAVAIAYAVSRSDVFDIKLILTATFNTTGRAVLTAKYIDSMMIGDGTANIDIGIGIYTNPREGLYDGVGPQMPWADGYDINSYKSGKIYDDGVGQAINIIRDASDDNPVYILAIAPYTNLAEMFVQYPELKSKVIIVVMGGSINIGYDGGPKCAEYNVKENVTASQIVFNYTNINPYYKNICCGPLDTTTFFQIYGDNYQTLLSSNKPIPTTIIQNYQVWYQNGGKNYGAYREYSPTTATSTMYDAQVSWMASEMALNSDVCSTMPYMMMTKGRYIVTDNGYTNNDPSSNIPYVYTGTSWNNGNNNGTYPLGTQIVSYLIK